MEAVEPENTEAPDRSEGGEPGGLACLAGGRPDDKLVRDWAAYQGLPAATRAALLELVQEAYHLRLGRELAQKVTAFAHQRGLDPLEAQSVLDLCRFLFRHAAGAGVSVEELRRDLERLQPDSAEGIDEFLHHYGSFGPLRRQEALHESLLDHGKVLSGVEWRLDVARASSHASRIDMPVVTLSLGYREGSGSRGREGVVNLQIPAAELESLREILDRIEIAIAMTLDDRETPGDA